MSDKIYPVPAQWAERAYINATSYQSMYDRSVTDPEAFWSEAGRRLDWIKPYTRAKNTTFGPGNVYSTMVRGRHAQRFGELSRSSSGDARRSDGDHLGRR